MKISKYYITYLTTKTIKNSQESAQICFNQQEFAWFCTNWHQLERISKSSFESAKYLQDSALQNPPKLYHQELKNKKRFIEIWQLKKWGLNLPITSDHWGSVVFMFSFDLQIPSLMVIFRKILLLEHECLLKFFIFVMFQAILGSLDWGTYSQMLISFAIIFAFFAFDCFTLHLKTEIFTKYH